MEICGPASRCEWQRVSTVCLYGHCVDNYLSHGPKTLSVSSRNKMFVVRWSCKSAWSRIRPTRLFDLYKWVANKEQ